MKMSPPRISTWLLATVIGGAGILMHLGILSIRGFNRHSFWLVVVAFGLLFLGSIFKEL